MSAKRPPEAAMASAALTKLHCACASYHRSLLPQAGAGVEVGIVGGRAQQEAGVGACASCHRSLLPQAGAGIVRRRAQQEAGIGAYLLRPL